MIKGKFFLTLPLGVLIFSFLLFKSPLKADTVPPKSFNFSNKIVAKIDRNKDDGGDEIIFFKNGEKTKCRFVEEPIRSLFDSVVEINLEGYGHPLFISEWSLGAHGQKFNIFDPAQGENCSLTQIEWGHPMTYTLEGDHLKIVKSEGTTENWKPTPLKESPARNLSAPHNP